MSEKTFGALLCKGRIDRGNALQLGGVAAGIAKELVGGRRLLSGDEGLGCLGCEREKRETTCSREAQYGFRDKEDMPCPLSGVIGVRVPSSMRR